MNSLPMPLFSPSVAYFDLPAAVKYNPPLLPPHSSWTCNTDLTEKSTKPGLTFPLHSMTVTIPPTAQDGELLLHSLRMRSEICELELNLIRIKVHQATIHLQVLHHIMDQAESDFRHARQDIGTARAILSSPDAPFNVSFATCETCKEVTGGSCACSL
ncbi:hypothetical protein C8F01DRAFT_1159728 [Mycena amicta]|nr:hypothetical protein C8F01DRAFT_1159728 [Mycena amicta]